MMLLFVGKMLKSASPQYPNRGSDARVIRLTTDQEAVLQEQFNRWPRAPHTADIVLLAAETGLSEADVEVFILFSEKRKYLKNYDQKKDIRYSFSLHLPGLVFYPISTVEEGTGSGRKSWFALTLTLFSNVIVTVYLKM